MPSSPPDITSLLREVNAERPGAMDRLMTAIYDELRAMAVRRVRREYGPGAARVTLQPTALVNEAFLRIIKQRVKYDNRGHFFGIATAMMLRVLKDYERGRGAAKRGGGCVLVSLDPNRDQIAATPRNDSGADLSPLVNALEKLDQFDARKAEIVKLRILWGLTIGEVADSLDVGHATVERDWKFARAWLQSELSGDKP